MEYTIVTGISTQKIVMKIPPNYPVPHPPRFRCLDFRGMLSIVFIGIILIFKLQEPDSLRLSRVSAAKEEIT